MVQIDINESDLLDWIASHSSKQGDRIHRDELAHATLTISRGDKNITTKPGDIITISGIVDHSSHSIRNRREALARSQQLAETARHTGNVRAATTSLPTADNVTHLPKKLEPAE